MTLPSAAIQVTDLSKIYRLYTRGRDRLYEALLPWFGKRHRAFFALRNVSFDVTTGETLGIIGKNGSGKSTLLKIVTGVLSPSSGAVRTAGRISALLELGAGFHPEFNGIENIYLSGTTMGFSRAQMQARLPQIVSFADIGDFIHQPVKTYSSGMFVRLAFATAINVDPDILIVDEALSVGDMFFQLKCYNKFEQFKKMGKTILFVTHDMSTILKYCDRAIVLEDGSMIGQGIPGEMVDLYKKCLVGALAEASKPPVVEQIVREAGSHPADVWKNQFALNPNTVPYGNEWATIFDFGLFDHTDGCASHLAKGARCAVRMRVKFNRNIEKPIFAFTIKDRKGTELCGTNTMLERKEIGPLEAGQSVEVAFTQAMDLQGGQYFLSLGCIGFDDNGDFLVYQRLYDVIQFDVVSSKNSVGIYDMNSQVQWTVY